MPIKCLPRTLSIVQVNNLQLTFRFRNFKQTPEADDDHEQELELEAGRASRLSGHRHERRAHRDPIAVARTHEERRELPGLIHLSHLINPS